MGGGRPWRSYTVVFSFIFRKPSHDLTLVFLMLFTALVFLSSRRWFIESSISGILFVMFSSSHTRVGRSVGGCKIFV